MICGFEVAVLQCHYKCNNCGFAANWDEGTDPSSGYNKEDETIARAILMETDLANWDHNMLRGDPSLTNVFDSYNPSSALIR